MPPPPPPKPGKPGKPKLVGANESQREKSRGDTFLNITWGTVSDVDSYHLEIKVEDNVSEVIVDAPPLLLKKRTHNTEHTLRVRSKKGNAFSNYSNELTIYTRPKTPKHPKLVGTSASADNPLADVAARKEKSLKLTWPSVGSGITYDLDFGGGDIRNGVFPGEVFASLDPNKLYKIRVRSRDDSHGGASLSFSPIRKVRTRPPILIGFHRMGFDRFFLQIQIAWDNVGIFPGRSSAKWQLARRKVGATSKPQVIADGKPNVTSFFESNFPVGTQQEYFIRITAGNNHSFWSARLLVSGPIINLIGIESAFTVVPGVGAAVPSLLDQSNPFRI